MASFFPAGVLLWMAVDKDFLQEKNPSGGLREWPRRKIVGCLAVVFLVVGLLSLF
jgi:hypothetical protein